jgi:hypothetical protein
MRLRDYKGLSTLILAIAIVVAPHLHALLGCDDDPPLSSGTEVRQQAQSHTVGTSNHNHHQRGLPDEACCELATALNVLAYSGGWARHSVGADSTAIAVRHIVVVRMTVAQPPPDNVCMRLAHAPPPGHLIFLALHSFLI